MIIQKSVWAAASNARCKSISVSAAELSRSPRSIFDEKSRRCISRGFNRAPSLTSVLPPKAQHNQGLLTPPATDVSGCHRADGTQLFAPRFAPEIHFLLRKGQPGAFPLCFSSPTTPQRQPRGVQDACWQQHRRTLSSAGRTPGPVTQPQPWLGAHLGTLDHPLAPGLSCFPAQAGCCCVGFTLFMAWALGSVPDTHTAPPRADVNAWGMFPNRAIMDLNDSIFPALAARCFQKPHVLSLS